MSTLQEILSLGPVNGWPNGSVITSEESLRSYNVVGIIGKNLTKFPDAVLQLTKMTALGLQENKLSSLPEGIGQLVNLQTLGLNTNKLSSVPDSITRLTGLTWLWLHTNELSSVPAGIGQLVNLQSLSLNTNKLSSVPDSITKLTGLTRLDLDENQLSSLPAGIGQLVNLESLNLNTNKLLYMPDSITKLTGLTFLSLHKNELSSLPAGIGQLVNLTELHIFNNPITELPESITLLKTLKIMLLIHQGELTVQRAPIGITALPCYSNDENPYGSKMKISEALKKLKLYSNHINKSLTNVGSLVQGWKLCPQIDISNNKISTLPDQLSTLTDLHELNISSNMFAEFPDVLLQMSWLTSFNIAGNFISALPTALASFTTLRSLDVGSLKIFSIPDVLLKMSWLTSLNIAGSTISSIPEAISILTQLSNFNASRNQFSEIPSTLMSVTSLKVLDLSSNKISEIPKTIQELHMLAELNIENNQIQKLSLALGCIESLKFIKYDGNPIQDPPRNILNRGSGAVINYLRTLNEGTVKWKQGRILLLGEGKVGKSTLVKALMQDPSSKFQNVCDENRDRTDGIARIDLDEIIFGVENETKLQVKVWDFGGQDDFQVTHPFFLSSGSLVIILYSLSQNATENKLDRWIQLLDDFAPGSTVLIVGTHRDKRNESHRQEMTREIEKLKRANTKKHKYMTTDIQVSSFNGKGINDLKAKIYESLMSLENVNLDIPKQYVRLKEYFEDKSKTTKTMKLEVVQSFSQSSLKMNESQLTTALNFLHDLGSTLWYSGQSNLRGIVFLDPLLLIDVFKSVFSFKAVDCNDGFVLKDKLFQKINLELALKSSTQQITPEIFLFILSLLEVFGLGFDFNPECMLFPILMNPKAIESCWNETPESHCTAELRFSFISGSQIQKSDVASILVTAAKLGLNSDSQIQYENVITNKFTIVNLQLSKNTQGFALVPGPYIRLLVQIQEKSVDVVIRTYNYELEPTEPQRMQHIFGLIDEKMNNIRNGLFHKTSFPCYECFRIKKAGAFIFTAARQKDLLNLDQKFRCDFWHEIQAAYLLQGRVFDEEGFMSKIMKSARSKRTRRPPPKKDSVTITDLDKRLESLNLTQKMELERYLGSGAFGRVFKSTLHGKPVAIKILDLIANGEQTIEVIQSLIEEATLMKECSGSEYIVKLFHTYRIDSRLHLVMEFGGKSLKDELEKPDSKLKQEEIVKYSKHICQALIFMHAKDLYHEDIKSDNILICKGIAKLADFGIVKHRGKDKVGSNLPTRYGEDKQDGTEHWQAPEIHNVVCKPHNSDPDGENIGHRGEPSNVYAFALLLWSMFSRKEPFYRESRPYSITIRGIRPEIPADVPYTLQRLIRVCWSQNYKKRPNFESVLHFLEFYEQKRFNLSKQETNRTIQISYAAVHEMCHGELCEFLADKKSIPDEFVSMLHQDQGQNGENFLKFSTEELAQRFKLSQKESRIIYQFVKKASITSAIRQTFFKNS